MHRGDNGRLASCVDGLATSLRLADAPSYQEKRCSAWRPYRRRRLVVRLSAIDIYLEVGKKRVFAVAQEWPGWARVRRDEAEALEALIEYAPRYAKVVRGLGFKAPARVEDLVVVERIAAGGTTDVGSLSGLEPRYDSEPVDEAEHARLAKMLEACWRELDRIADAARGKELSTGVRGGGRSLDRILQHVLDAEGGYLHRLEYRRSKDEEKDFALSRAAMLEGLAAAIRGEVPEFGPRGGRRWSGRYFVRREAWHVLDHAWEIEDRAR